MSPGYSSGDSAATSTACHVVGPETNGGPAQTRFLVQRQQPAAAAGDQPLTAQRRPDRHPALAAPGGDQRVHPADLLVGQPDRAAGEQPAADHPATDRVGQRRQRLGVEPVGGRRRRPSPARSASRSASVSSRSAVAVRASASATPPPSTSSSSGSTSWRSRVRVKRRSALCGSCQASAPSSAHAAWVTSRRTPSSGRHQGGS